MMFMLPQHGVSMGVGNCTDVPVLGGKWRYNWNPQLVDCSAYEWDSAVDAIPMIWGKSHMGMAISPGSVYLLGFNEPDLVNQANITPTLAAQLWRQVDVDYPERLLVSPAVMDLDWLRYWRVMYFGMYGEYPRLSAIAVHVYTNTVQAAKNIVLEAEVLAKEWNISQVWITEYAFLPCDYWNQGINYGVGNMENAVNMGREFTLWLQQRGHRYAWFTNTDLYKWWGATCDTSLVLNG